MRAYSKDLRDRVISKYKTGEYKIIDLAKLFQIDRANLVFCDETGVDDNISPIYGWSEKGNRAYGEVRGYRKDRRSIIAGYAPGSKQLIAPMEYHGYR